MKEYAWKKIEKEPQEKPNSNYTKKGLKLNKTRPKG